MDLDDEFLRRLTVGVRAFGYCETHSGFRLKFTAGEVSSLHYCLSGNGVMRLEDGTSIEMTNDTLVLVPVGVGYGFEAGADIRQETPGQWQAPNDENTLQIYRSGNGDADPLVVACCEATLRLDSNNNLLDHLVTSVADTQLDPGHLQPALRAALAELESDGFGARALIETLLKELFIRVLRRHAQAGETSLSWLGAVTNQQMGRALALMSRRLADPLTIDDIAAEAGMSRSVLFERFAKSFGKSPMRFLYDNRLAHAASLLTTTDETISGVATSVGYRSRSHFTRDFKKQYGAGPKSYRTRGGVAHQFPQPDAELPHDGMG